MEKKFNYEEAVSKLEEIVRKMESGEQNIDSICEQLKTAKQLIKQCKEKLTKTDEALKKLLDEWKSDFSCTSGIEMGTKHADNGTEKQESDKLRQI